MLSFILYGGALAAQAMAGSAEWSARPSVPGFAVGFDRANAEQSIVEQVPKGETVEYWSRMFTSQRFVGRGRDPGPQGLLNNIKGLFARACPAGRTSPIAATTVSGRPAAQLRADCPLNSETGKPETFFIVAFAGARDLYSEQVAFRRVPAAADIAFAKQTLQTVRLCTTASKDTACKKH